MKLLQDEQQKIIALEVDNLFQFVITLTIFFIVIIEIIFKVQGTNDIPTAQTQLHWTLPIAGFLLDYFLYKCMYNLFSSKKLIYIKYALLLEIFVFIFPLIALNDPNSFGIKYNLLSLGSALLILAFVPIFILIYMLICSIIIFINKFIKENHHMYLRTCGEYFSGWRFRELLIQGELHQEVDDAS